MGCFIAFIGVFYLFGFGLLGFGLWSARQSTQAAHWPTVPGTMTHLEVASNPDSDGTTYRVDVRYAYEVAGVAYEGTRLAFGYTGSGDRPAHDQIHKKLVGAKAVAVRYDPSDPSVSCLSFGFHRSIQFVFAFAVTWLAFVIGFTLIYWLASRDDTVLLNNLSVQ